MYLRYYGFVALICSSFNCMAVDIPSMESGNYSQYCTELWTKRGELDRKMFAYCMDLQQRGYGELKTLVNKYSDHSWIQPAVNYAVTAGTKKGARQDSMVAYELKKVIDGWEDLVYEAKQPNYDKAKYIACYKKWNIRFYMVAHCYKN